MNVILVDKKNVKLGELDLHTIPRVGEYLQIPFRAGYLIYDSMGRESVTYEVLTIEHKIHKHHGQDIIIKLAILNYD